MKKNVCSMFFRLSVLCAFIIPFLTVADERLEIVGSGDGVVILNELKNDFLKEHPDTSIDIPVSIGSGGGIKAVAKDEFILGRVARKFRKDEKHYGLVWKHYANVPVVFAVNKAIKIDTLSPEQVCRIFSGDIKNWNEIGGPDMKIRVVAREKGDSSHITLNATFPGFKDVVFKQNSKIAYRTPDNFNLIASKEGAIGFGPMDVALKSDTRIVKIASMNPNDSCNPLALIFKPVNNKGLVKRFVDYVFSERAKQIISKAGGIPVATTTRY